jgi:predicted dehydrogenase
MAPLRVGLIGCGNWGAKLARNLAATPEVRLAAACDTDAERAAATAALHGAGSSWTDADAMLAHGGLDAAVVATPASTHASLVTRALEAGLHVLAEKPLATSAAAGADLHRRARERGRVVLTDHTELYSDAFRAVAARVAAGDTGEVRTVVLDHANRSPGPPDTDLLWDLAPHDFAILEALLDAEPRHIDVRTGRGTTGTGLAIALRYPHGVRARITIERGAPGRRRTLLVRGTRGEIAADGFGPGAIVRSRAAGEGNGSHRVEAVIPCDDTEPLRVLCATFAALAAGDEAVRPDGAADVRILERIEAAARCVGRGSGFGIRGSGARVTEY